MNAQTVVYFKLLESLAAALNVVECLAPGMTATSTRL